MLGYKWNTCEDSLHPGISELNVNKKIRGVQKPNSNPVETESDAEIILRSASLTRRIVISKIAEFFDPVGLWEPLKLQLKLHSARLNSLPWDQKLSSEEEKFWKIKLIQFVRFRELSAPRCTTPPDSKSFSGIRLICLSDAPDDWNLPGRAEVDFWSYNRGLTKDILNQVEVREIVVGFSTDEEIDEITSWFWDKYAIDQKILPTNVVSMDVEEIKVTLYDTLRIAGRLPFKKGQVMSRKEEPQIHGQPEDRLQQLPVKVMIGNGLNHALMVSLDLFRDSKGRYVLNKIRAPDSIIKFFSLLPICTGVAVKHDIEGVIKFYSLITDLDVTMKGFIEVSSVALVAGYALQARNMNALAMQVLGIVMNKMCSTADNLWGLRWSDIPDSLKVYAIGDLKVGHLAYSILSSIIMRDYIPDPEIFLFYTGKFDQWLTANWFLNLMVTTLEGT